MSDHDIGRLTATREIQAIIHRLTIDIRDRPTGELTETEQLLWDRLSIIKRTIAELA